MAATVCQCEDCAYPTTDDLRAVIELHFPGSPMPDVDVTNFHPVCLAFSDHKDLYRAISIIVEYTCSGNSNCPAGNAMEQIEAECIAGVWSSSVLGNTDNTRSPDTTANTMTSTREDCAFCLSPTLADRFSLTSDDVTHCVGQSI